MIAFVLVSLACAGVTFALSFIIWKLALRFKLYPKIRVRDVHTRPTPRLGGIAMFLGMVVSFGIASQVPYFRLVFANPEPILAILGASLLIVLIGVADDIWDLDWTTKLAGQLIAAGLIAWKGVQIVSLPIGGLTVGSPWMSLIITVLAIVLVTNALNFIDGLDGLVAGVALIANGVFFLYSYLLVQRTSPTDYFNLASLIAVVLVGACAGFLPINWRPARMFMGDGGALLVGMLMATAAVAVTGQIDPAQLKAKELLPAFIPIILPFAILIVPLMDFGLAVFRRLRAGKSPFSADRKHLHHRLLDMGHSHLHAVLIFYSWTAVIAFGCLLIFVVDVIWIPLAFLGVGLVACTVVTLAPLSRRKRLEAAAQSAEASPVLDPLDRASAADPVDPPVGLPLGRDTAAPSTARKEAS
ncbi:undecaprenyl/decaprenyl-phosphate alpha-N-acetylglucosaminyl 1-phosphate transferase [Rathayibacter sp. ZW T2_19]|uniref:Undecaprenyl/decaprenyl-phosphate alpha-N-acetylglucosaminyl 1-phosphate transferase n=1 Tax=Rathayibacter rubneri TaxID=2950106 RepID=A0A9X2DV66_9MICO|nr:MULTISPECIES: MraY family glycosyltransferase [Rathayibacter]MBO0982863.1 undecaprenyl/decaprenyl-phosphate alpha-N-acetylglucosaminyl 1-phosphate transferase [Rathayibacter sp. SD072]MCM6761093.1 undecaprenyl/decaprenyl-phosphate alpha-N-acetylglucosaminyl 1-phosphate transferase [Rathayibacter rubneri]